ncbi:ABC-three component system middle component 1 [Sedimentibacter sp.]|uniref:ABC-three component system middle component 1 n=1 Tax=Sedimentibacter sp. TaxID=1960295 RepID=UPI0028AA6B7F|nr:ABC-three component system middle component 1 [Sedimentibacter sp.]
MKFENIRIELRNIIKERYIFEENSELINKLLSLSDDHLTHKDIFRIKRLSTKVDSWKTLIFAEVVSNVESEIKAEFKSVLSWTAHIKESLLGSENTDLYLFLSFNSNISDEECLRIESTEQFCRKYVMLPNEEISDFIERTFLQELISSKDVVENTDPLKKAFTNTYSKFQWLTPEVQKEWKKAFFDLSGSELCDQLLEWRG